MIHYRTHKNIDIIKYDRCIQDSFNSRIYAFSWYLNCVTDDWDALVLNDYEAVMPLPKRKKFGMYYIYQAPWIQQLGVFSEGVLKEDLIYDFIIRIPKKFILVDYFFNSQNIISKKNIVKRVNFILELKSSYKEIFNNFNKNRKRALKSDFSNYELDKNGKKKGFLDLYHDQEKKYKTHKDSFEKLQNLLNSNQNSIHIWNVYKSNEMVAGLVWLKDKNRITYLLPVAKEQAKKQNIPSFIINELIKEHQNMDYLLDFEGSMVPGVAQFYKSFGAREEVYYWYKRRLL